MPHTVTITIPDQLYRQVEQTAEAIQQTVAQVLSEHVVETFRPFPTIHSSPNRSAMLREVDAYIAMHPDLVTRFLGQFVAIYQGRIVDHDFDEDALMKRRQRDYPGKVVLVRQVEAEADRELNLRTPRFAS